MGAVVPGVEPETELVLIRRETLAQRGPSHAGKNHFMRVFGFFDKVLLDTVHKSLPGKKTHFRPLHKRRKSDATLNFQ
jgi:hypothetical protein